jgi:hypothetical protein
MPTHHHQLETSSKTDEHYTPARIKEVLSLFRPQGFDLDPCSNSKANPNIPADCHYTIEDNGLIKPWFGSVFCNPPFSDMKNWVDKALHEFVTDHVEELILLTKFDARVGWFPKLMYSDMFCVVEGYCRYGNAKNAATFSTVLWYFGDRQDEFIYHFEDLGWVCARLLSNPNGVNIK